MLWKIDGADVRTGKNRTLSIDADTIDQAEAIARARRLLVADIQPIEGNEPADDDAPLAVRRAALCLLSLLAMLGILCGGIQIVGGDVGRAAVYLIGGLLLVIIIILIEGFALCLGRLRELRDLNSRTPK